jgi:hypothetical protein
VTATEGTAFTGAVASFTDANPDSVASDFTAVITWGDGHTSTGTVMATGSSGFQVTGSNTFAEEGSSVFTVTITDIGGSTTSISGTATIADAPLTATGANATATVGVSFSGVVASFTDADPNATVADYTAVINWGDGASSAGSIAYDSGQQVFTVAGSHTYITGGNQAVSVVITDQGTQATAMGDIQVTVPAPPPVVVPPLVIVCHDFGATEGVGTGKIVLATFTDSSSAQQYTGYRARISWGDGTTSSAGTIVANPDGTFSVVGQHTYAREGKYTVQVLVNRPNSTPASAACTATVADSIPVVAITAVQGSSSRKVELTVAYADTGWEKHTLLVDWGDGTRTTLDLETQRYGLSCVRHDYAKDPATSAQLVVTVVDGDGTASEPAALTVQFKTGTNRSPVRQSTGWDAFYAAIASQLAAFFRKGCD